MLAETINYVLHNFPLVMFVLALILPMFSRGNFKSVFCRCMFILPVGLGGIWGFVMHAFYPELASRYIGWQASLFEFEVALTNLAFGVTGILAGINSKSYKYAVAMMVSIFLWGAAASHIQQIITLHNYNPGNAGSILFTDIILPFTLWVSIFMMPAKSRNELDYMR